MEEGGSGRVTELLASWGNGNPQALEALMPLVYDELRRLADRQLRSERPNHTLQRTALVNEAFLRLVNQQQPNLQGHAHFLGLASQLMRRILVDHARARRAAKRGSGVAPISLNQTGAFDPADEDGEAQPSAIDIAAHPESDLAAIDSALSRLEQIDPDQAKLVELRFFGGLTIEETAGVMGVSAPTIKRDWALARAWLKRELGAEPT
jgi:RNA polymerase sigma factor (TIGR02999 family)